MTNFLQDIEPCEFGQSQVHKDEGRVADSTCPLSSSIQEIQSFLAVASGRDSYRCRVRLKRKERKVQVVRIIFDEKERLHSTSESWCPLFAARDIPPSGVTCAPCETL